MRKITLLLVILSIFVKAQIPNGYYDDAQGLTGENLRTALYNIIKDHNSRSYDNLWTDFESTDKKSNGKVWDMYSTKADGTFSYEYTFGSDQCDNYSGEGSCYNREHSFPKSWFDEDYPMYTDLFHLYPTDGYVNSMRSNYPYGETNSPSWTSSNGSKRGACSYPGYSGTIFEPIDEYKGDFARTYFYMVTRYKNITSNWDSDMLSGDNLSTWAVNLLVDWAEQDPVSQKELNRNNAVYNIQYNRNPYIDHPEYICYIWTGCESAITETGTNVSISIYPNPAKDNVTITYNSVDKKSTIATIHNLLGTKIQEIELHQNLNKLNIETYKKGIYFIKINNSENLVIRKFVVK